MKGSRFVEGKPSPGPGDYDLYNRNSGRGLKEHLKTRATMNPTNQSSVHTLDPGSPKSSIGPGPGDYEIYKSTLVKNGPNFLKVQFNEA